MDQQKIGTFLKQLRQERQLTQDLKAHDKLPFQQEGQQRVACISFILYAKITKRRNV